MEISLPSQMAFEAARLRQAQQEIEQNYREIVENSNSIILTWDLHGTLTYINRFAEKLFGFTRSELVGQSLIGTIVPETDSSGRDLVEMIRKITTDPDAYISNENENICKNGERVWISWNNRSLSGADGTRTGVLSIGQDITARKKFESELRRSEERFRSFVEHANDVVFALTPEGIFSYVSPRWKEAFGYELSETLGKPFIPFVHPDDVRGCFKFLQKVMETGEKQSGIEYRVRCKDGRLLWYTANASLVRDPENHSTTFLGIGRDITEYKKSEELLRQSEKKFSTVFHASPDAIVLSRFSDGMMLEVNESFTRITGFTADEVLGKTSQELNLWSDFDDRIKLGEILRKHGEINFFEAYFKTKSGPDRLGQISVRSIEIDNIPCLLSIMRDITEREHLLNELIKAQKLESISVLASGIAHNFNNVLTGVIGYISYARKNIGDSGKVLQILESAEKSSYRAAGLARQLLNFSQGVVPAKRTVSVDSLVEESVSLFLSGSNVKGTIACSSHLVINVDSQQINQALNNIVLNALHAMPDGGTLAVRVDEITLGNNNRFALPSGNYAQIIFEDSGCGIEKDHLSRIYDPYFTTKESGTGLGLSTTHSIISKHAGYIDITSEVGTGTCVTILLPAASEDQTDEASPVENHPVRAPILVMDDEKLIRDFVEELLNDMGYTVTTCASGEEACARYREFRDAGNPFPLSILDLSVRDGMGGVEAAQQILVLDPHACLIASSGYAHDPAIADYELFGFCGSITKPYSTDQLAQTIKKVLKGR